MRVLHVITGLAAGGAERQLLLLLRHLDADCEVATLTNPGMVAAALRADGVLVHDLGMRGNRDLAVLPRLMRLMRAGRYDVVHTHLFRAGLYGRLAARLTGVPVVVASEHSIGETRLEGRSMGRGLRALYRATERLGDVTVAVSPTVAGRLTAWGIPPSRVVMIPIGVDARAFRYDPDARTRLRSALGIPVDAFVVGGVGRLEHGKRFDLLIEAMAGVDRAVLLLVGAGAAREELRALADRHGMAGRTVFTGESAEVEGLMSAMDVLASPSPEETFGLAVLEGLAAGLPVRYATCPALDDLGDAVPQGPVIRRIPATAGAFRTELTELAQLTELAERAAPAVALPPGAPADRPGPAAVIDHYDIGRVAAQIDGLYERLLAARKRAPGELAPSAGGTR